MSNPIEDIENEKGQIDLGVLAARVYKGAKSESDNWWDAYIASCAYFSGMFHGPSEPPDNNEDKE